MMATSIPLNEMSAGLAAVLGSVFLVCLDSRMDLTEEDAARFAAGLPFPQLVKGIVTFKNVQKCEEYVRQAKNDGIVLCVNADNGKVIVPQVHALPHVCLISMYCSDVTKHKKWVGKYDKVR